MANTTGLYPQLKVDTTASGAVGQAGGVLLTETIAATGIGRELSAALGPWRKPLAVHDPAKVITDLAVTLALGGDCLADIAVLRAEPGLYGLVASDATVSRTIDALATDASAALKAIDTARAAARKRAWVLAGADAPDHHADARKPLIVDLDATLVASHSEKELAKPNFKRSLHLIDQQFGLIEWVITSCSLSRRCVPRSAGRSAGRGSSRCSVGRSVRVSAGLR